MFTIAPTISHTHVCSVWLYPPSQTHKTDVQLGCFCTAKRTRSRSQHPSSLSCLSSQLQGRDFKLKETTSFGLIRPQTRFTLRHWAGQGGHFKQGKKNGSPSQERVALSPYPVASGEHIIHVQLPRYRERSHVRVKLTLIKLTIRVQVDYMYRSQVNTHQVNNQSTSRAHVQVS